MNIENKMDQILREICHLDLDMIINDDMSPKTVEGWDSMANMQLIMELEDTFGVEFDVDELLNIGNWGDFKKAVRKKIEEK